MKKISVHDNFIISYEVDCEARIIRLVTEYRDRGEPFERTTVVFNEVEAYQFQSDCFGNIIFDIEEVTPESILEGNAAEFEKGAKYGWPACWKDSLGETLRYIKAENIRGFELSSSYGLCGWILA